MFERFGDRNNLHRNVSFKRKVTLQENRKELFLNAWLELHTYMETSTAAAKIGVHTDILNDQGRRTSR